jgi:hypothetical protein
MVCITKTNGLMLFRIEIRVHRENYVNLINTLCEQNVEFSNVKAGGM